ncbi:MAG: prophage LambdaCh01, site-specific recombinase, phage integrase family [Herbinix sp.]|jgi:integrase|nr:prophage LambdaCh01, site-specific recombinase, phage integrase family [Herbinix sp.]
MKGVSIYQRKSDNKWVGVIENGKKPNGNRNRITVYGDTKPDVVAKTNVILYEIQTDQYISPNKDMLISYLNDYYKICCDNWESTTADLYRLYIDVHFSPYFKETKLSDIKPMVLDTFYNYKMKTPRKHTVMIKGKPKEKTSPPLSINSVRKLNSFLKSAFKYAIANDLMKTNPADKVKLGRKEKYLPEVYNEDQFLLLLNHVAGTDDEIPIILGGGCGLRRGEIFGLYWRNIDIKSGYIIINQTTVRFKGTIEKSPKNESSCRTFKAPKYVMDILENYKKRVNGKSGQKVITRWKPGTYSERFSDLLERFKLPHIRLHDLRHYNAVIMCKYGVSDKVAAERLGHSQVSTLRNVYQHVLKDMDQTAADEIDAMFLKQKEKDEKKANFKVV